VETLILGKGAERVHVHAHVAMSCWWALGVRRQDLNQIREHFLERMVGTTQKVRVAKSTLCYYNNLDVVPGLEALRRMRLLHRKGDQHPERHCSHPRRELALPVVERGGELYKLTLCEICVTKIRGHQIENSQPCKNILGYDSNALYLLTIFREMPCGGKVVHFIKGSKTGTCLALRKWISRSPETCGPSLRGVHSFSRKRLLAKLCYNTFRTI